MNRHIKSNWASVSLFVFTSLHAANALADTKPKAHTGPLGMEYLMDAEASYGRENNITLQSEPEDAIDSDFYSVAPEFSMQSQINDDYYSLSYKGDYKNYNASDADSYQDHQISTNNVWQFGSRHLLKLYFGHSWDHEVRGDDSTGDLSTEQLEYYGVKEALLTGSTFGEMLYQYGAWDSEGKLEFALTYRDKTFRDLDSVAESTSVPDFVDYLKGEEFAVTSAQFGFVDDYSSDTTFRYSLLRNNIAYNADSSKDTNEYYLRMGMKTTLGSKFVIDGNISWLHKVFINLDAKPFDGFNWDANLAWKPDNYSTWKATTSQNTEDSSEGGEYTLNTSAGISWQHFWGSDRFSTIAGYDYSRKKHQNDDSGRLDHNNELSLAMSYDFRPSINFTIKYMTVTDRSNLEYDNFYINQNHNPMTTLGYDQSKLVLTAKVQI
ncbi:outer membrane beta-barrel protein [Vibrio hannami]|uniref:outer membrane beta-barrel protein n=1 Tax=Vibrio hannami TaxID=2717094 RepID=UPI00240FE85B|nr:outer membrane beta-barrel protein [Vibrio hannami]MDG3087043.1 outer membrane beta-barrel protein [Vibrio hannami]